MKNLFRKGILGLTFIFVFMLFGVNNVYAAPLNVTIEPVGAGTVDVNGNIYTATANNHYVFDKWGIALNELGVYNRTDNPLNIDNFIALEPTGLVAHFIYNAITHNVELHTNGGTIINDNITEYIEGDYTTLPTNVEKEGFNFIGWYDNEEFNGEMITEITSSDTGDKEYWAKWEEVEQPTKIEYTIEAQNPNVKDTITFTYLEGEVYDFAINNILDITDEQLQETADLFNDSEYTFEILKEQLNKLINYGNKAADGRGKLLKLYEIYLFSNGTEIHEIEGGFKLKLKITDDIKDYDSYKLIYIADDGSTEDAIELTKNGEYLEGTLPHLSMYALVGSKNETTTNISNPKTGDNIIFYVLMLVLSVIGFVGVKLHTRVFNK